MNKWQQAKDILDQMVEPSVSGREKHLYIQKPNILGYPCEYVRHLTSKGVASWFVLFNYESNIAYVKHFDEPVGKTANRIFYENQK